MQNSINNITENEWDSLNQVAKDFQIDTIDESATLSLKGYKEHSDGSSASYYSFPFGFSELQDLISHKNMNAQIGEIFRACYRYGEVAHSPLIRDIKKIIFYAEAELVRLERLKDVS